MITHASRAQDLDPKNFRTGDLLFQDIDCGGLCDAIEKVTAGVKGYHFSHVGLVYKKLWHLEVKDGSIHFEPWEQKANRGFIIEMKIDTFGNE